MNAGADEPQVRYVQSSTAASFLSLDDAKSHCNIPLATTTHDEELKWMLAAATDVVEYFCGPVRRVTQTNVVQGGSSALLLHHTQILSVTSVTPIFASSPSVTVADLDIDTDNGILRHTGGLAISSGHGAGCLHHWSHRHPPTPSTGPPSSSSKHLWETQRGPGRPGVLGQQSTQGGETTFLPVLGFAIPNRAMDLMNLHPVPAGVA